MPLLNWFLQLFRCSHHFKTYVGSTEDLADPHARLVGFTKTYQCIRCGKYIREYERYTR